MMVAVDWIIVCNSPSSTVRCHPASESRHLGRYCEGGRLVDPISPATCGFPHAFFCVERHRCADTPFHHHNPSSSCIPATSIFRALQQPRERSYVSYVFHYPPLRHTMHAVFGVSREGDSRTFFYVHMKQFDARMGRNSVCSFGSALFKGTTTANQSQEVRSG